jgi:hypothetical protein
VASPLLTRDQKMLEEAQAGLLRRREIAAARAAARTLMMEDHLAATDDGARLLDGALDRWLSRLCLMSAMRASGGPLVLWCNQLAAYEWQGRRVPASAAAVDTPDFIYRFACIDGSRTYTLSGAATQPASALFIQISDDHPGSEGFALPKEDGHSLASPGLFDAAAFDRAADGSFQVSIGPAQARANHIQVPPDRLQILFRDVLNAWTEHPHALTITPHDGPQTFAIPSLDSIVSGVAADFAPSVGFWLRLKERFHSLADANRPYGPIARNHHRELSLMCRFRLAPGEVLVMSMKNVPACYFGVQVADVWMMLPDPARHSSSLNRTQSWLGLDGRYTYIVSPEDPGMANWLDTAGSRDGYVLFRWLGTSRDEDTAVFAGAFEVKRLAELTAELPAHRLVDCNARNTELARRAMEWRLRITDDEGVSHAESL